MNSVVFSSDGMQLASGSSDGTVWQWNAVTGHEIHRFEGHADDVNSVAYSSNGIRLASGSDDGTVRLWDVSNGNEIRRFEDHGFAVTFVGFSPDRTWLATGSHDQPVRLWAVPVGFAGEVVDRTFIQDIPIADLILPDGMYGTAPYTFMLEPALPPGLIFDSPTRTISGTPSETTDPVTYTDTVTNQTGDSERLTRL